MIWLPSDDESFSSAFDDLSRSFIMLCIPLYKNDPATTPRAVVATAPSIPEPHELAGAAEVAER